jgi:tetrahydromethanopterin S-methyltransferase subunit G
MEIKRIDILLNKTREELPRVYVTKTELIHDMDRLFKRFDKLEEKIDEINK